MKSTLGKSKKKDSKVARKKKAESELKQRDRAMKVEYCPIEFVEEEETTEVWQQDLMTEEYHCQILKTLLLNES